MIDIVWVVMFGVDLVKNLFDVWFDEILVVYVFGFFLILDDFGVFEVF